MPKISLPPFGFWSYVRRDDELSDGDISNLRALVEGYLERQTGETARIFQDTRAIEHGADWESETREALARANFFIPVLTPNYLRSLWCCKEVRFFLDRQKQLFETHPDLPTRSRIFPILYTDIADVDSIQPEIRDTLASLQFFDFTELQFLPSKSPEVRRAVSGFVGDIRKLLQARVEAVEEPKPPPAPRKRRPKPSPAAESGAGAAAAAPFAASPPDPPPAQPEPPPVQPTGDRGNLVSLLVVGGIFGVLMLVVLILAVIGSAGAGGDSSNTYVTDYAMNEADMNMTTNDVAMDPNMAMDMNATMDMNTTDAADMVSNTIEVLPASPVYRQVNFVNDCHKGIELRLHYFRDGAWRDPAGDHWLMNPNESRFLEDLGVRLQATSPDFYYHARIADDTGMVWEGPYSRVFSGTSYKTRYYAASVGTNGAYVIRINCQNVPR